MDIFHEMRKYRTGHTEDGNEEFEVPLQADEDGMIGRECPNEDCEPKYFKVSLTIPGQLPEQAASFSQSRLTCPYCGTRSNMQHFHTNSQIEWIKSMLMRDVVRSVQNMFGDALKPKHTRSGGLFSINITYKPGPLPSVRHYVEDKLKRTVTCENCKYNYAIYGISFQCPLCGEGNLLQHFNRSADIVRVLLEESRRISREKGAEVEQKMLGNALEDVVGLFEAFLKNIYIYAEKQKFHKDDVNKKKRKVGTTFQRLVGAEDLFRKDLSFELYDNCSREEMVFLEEQFLKRHVMTHNMGLVDEKYIGKAKTYEKQGAELVVEGSDVSSALDIVEKIVSNAISFHADSI